MSEIAKLNDEFRKQILQRGVDTGKAVMTPGIADLGSMAQAYIYSMIMNYDRWDYRTDPHQEHDFGVIEAIDLPKIYWKIDYYENADMEYGTEDKQNCYRVLVIMLSSEY